MGYLNSTLLKDEKIIYLTHPCRVVFVRSMVILTMAIVLYVFGSSSAPLNMTVMDYPLYEIAAIMCALAGLFDFSQSYISYTCSEYGITNKRVLMKSGWIQRDSFEIFLDKIEAVRVEQTITGRFFNYGSIVIVGTGGSADPFMGLPNPLQFRTMIQQQIDRGLHS